MNSQEVSITDINIPFGRMVMIILKWMLASIPAAILMWCIVAFFTMFFGGCTAMMMR